MRGGRKCEGRKAQGTDEDVEMLEEEAQDAKEVR